MGFLPLYYVIPLLIYLINIPLDACFTQKMMLWHISMLTCNICCLRTNCIIFTYSCPRYNALSGFLECNWSGCVGFRLVSEVIFSTANKSTANKRVWWHSVRKHLPAALFVGLFLWACQTPLNAKLLAWLKTGYFTAGKGSMGFPYCGMAAYQIKYLLRLFHPFLVMAPY